MGQTGKKITQVCGDRKVIIHSLRSFLLDTHLTYRLNLWSYLK